MYVYHFKLLKNPLQIIPKYAIIRKNIPKKIFLEKWNIFFFIKIWVPFHYFLFLRKIYVRLLFHNSKNSLQNIPKYALIRKNIPKNHIFRKMEYFFFHKNLGTVSLFSIFKKNLCTSTISYFQKFRYIKNLLFIKNDIYFFYLLW